MTSAGNTVRSYYDSLRTGEPLAPYFRAEESTVKFGITESLFGAEPVTAALREQTATTTDWTVESHQLVVAEWDGFATVADEVLLAWTDTETGDRHRYDTRWSGTLVPTDLAAGTLTRTNDETLAWQFVLLHVSTPPDE